MTRAFKLLAVLYALGGIGYAWYATAWAASAEREMRRLERDVRRVENALYHGLQTHGVEAGDRELLRILREERFNYDQALRRGALPPLGGMGLR